jgi:hypothetical protein
MGHSHFTRIAIIHLLDDQKNAWSGTANVLEEIERGAGSEALRRRIAEQVRECRGRAEAIRRTVARMADSSLTAD